MVSKLGFFIFIYLISFQKHSVEESTVHRKGHSKHPPQLPTRIVCISSTLHRMTNSPFVSWLLMWNNLNRATRTICWQHSTDGSHRGRNLTIFISNYFFGKTNQLVSGFPLFILDFGGHSFTQSMGWHGMVGRGAHWYPFWDQGLKRYFIINLHCHLKENQMLLGFRRRKSEWNKTTTRLEGEYSPLNG